MKIALSWLGLALLATVLGGCARRGDDTLIVGMELSYPPFEMTDAQGNPTGLEVDFARELAAALHRRLVIENIPFDGLIPSLKTGKIDLILSAMTANEERAQSIDFSDPYVHTGICLLVGKNSGIHSLADLDQDGRQVVVKKATTGHSFATNHLRHARTLVLDQDSACVLEVIEGKADGFIYDQISILQNWQRHPDTTVALLDPIQKENWAMGIRKGNDALREQVNVFLHDFQARRGFDRLSEIYLQDQKAAFARLGYPFLFQ